MTTPRIPANLLPPVDIPLLQPPIPDDIEGADGGIGLRHIEHPLLVHMARPENTPPGTVFELYWGDPQSPVAGNFIRDDDEDLTRIPFIVPVDHILESWADPVYAKVIRNGEDGDETARLRLRVNLQRPGGRDPDDEAPGHQRLVYELPLDVLIDGVDDARAERGVEIVCRHWENMAPYDLLILVWGSERIEHRVQPEEVNTDIHLTVDYATIGAAGNGEAIPVGFQVVGPTGNYPDEWARWSAITWVDVYLDTERPEAPWLTFPETERDIELEQLGGQGVRVGARVSSADARAYSIVTLVWAGTDNEGVAVPHLESQNLSGGKAYYFNIENALVAALAKGTAYVYYLLQGEGVPEKRSYNRHLRILGDVVRWPAPTIDQLIDDHLDSNLFEVTVRFPAQASWPDGARLEVMLVAEGEGGPIERWIGAPVGDFPTTPEGEKLVMVSGSILKCFNGYSTEVYYVLSRQGALPQESLRLTVHVSGVELEIEQTKMQLNGFSLKVPEWPRTGEDSIGNTGTRVASGGLPPYRYSSSNMSIASVDPITGKVTGNRNGSVVITVTDSNDAELTYPVEVSNVWRLNINEALMNGSGSIRWMQSIGGASIYAYYSLARGDVARVYLPLPSRNNFFIGCALLVGTLARLWF
jgi:hypothetical protein